MSKRGPANTGRKQGGQFAPGTSGNPAGRPLGSRHRTTIALEALLDGDAEKLTRRAIELAEQGDPTALKLCMERLLPPRKERPTPFRFPLIQSARDAAKAASALVDAVAAGDLTAGEAQNIARLLEAYVKALEATDFEERLSRLESVSENEA